MLWVRPRVRRHRRYTIFEFAGSTLLEDDSGIEPEPRLVKDITF